MQIYNKLVRDNIPELIEAKGEPVEWHVAGVQEFEQMLFQKVFEEIQELKNNPSAEELADLYEVFEALRVFYGYSPEAVLAAKEKKLKEKGGFTDRIILEKA